MTGAEWLGGEDLFGMLEHVRPRASGRKLRLFSCGCVRELGHLLPGPPARQAFFVAERLADDRAGADEWAAAHAEARRAYRDLFSPESPARDYPPRVFHKVMTVHDALVQATNPAHEPFAAAFATVLALTEDERLPAWRKRLLRLQCDLLRDLFGNPFRPLTLDRRWLRAAGAAPAAIAATIYADRSFDELPVLADALTDAGCADDELLRHCREPGVHGRGCWAVDSLLGRR
jgi:hypothetical protein